MKRNNSQGEKSTQVSQNGSANKLIQVGRDYIRSIQFNFATENWLVVLLEVGLPVLFIGAGVKTIEYVSILRTIFEAEAETRILPLYVTS